MKTGSVLVPVAVILVLTAEIRLEPGVLGATEQRKQLKVVTDASEGVYRPTIVLGNLKTASGRPSNDAFVGGAVTDELSR